MAAEATLMGALKTIRTGRPENLYESFMEDENRITMPTKKKLRNMSTIW